MTMESKGAEGKREEKKSGPSADSSSITERAFAYFDARYDSWQNAELMELFDYEARHWQSFDFDPDVHEFRLEHSAMHRNYCELFEDCLEGFLAELGVGPRIFYQQVRDELHAGGTAARSREGRIGSRSSSSASIKFLALLEKIVSFEKWAASMRDAAAQQRKLDELD